jgi:hypothetical protein
LISALNDSQEFIEWVQTCVHIPSNDVYPGYQESIVACSYLDLLEIRLPVSPLSSIRVNVVVSVVMLGSWIEGATTQWRFKGWNWKYEYIGSEALDLDLARPEFTLRI